MSTVEIVVSAPGHRARRRSLPYSTAGHFLQPHGGAHPRGGRPVTPAGTPGACTAAAADGGGRPRDARDRGRAVPAQVAQ